MQRGLKKLLTQELERKQIALFSRGHQGRKNSRRYVQLIDAQDELTRRPAKNRPSTKRRR